MLDNPTADELAKILGGLLGKNVKVTPAKAALPNLTISAIFRSDGDNAVAACIADVALAAYSGAALSMLPPDTAKVAIKTGKLDGDLTDNYAEVLNVFSRLFSSDSSSRVVLQSKHFPPEKVPDSLKSPRKRQDFEIDVVGYGKGGLAVMVF